MHRNNHHDLTLLRVGLSHFGLLGSDLNRRVTSRLLRGVTQQLVGTLPRTSAVTQLSNSRFTILFSTCNGLSDLTHITAQLSTGLHLPIAISKRRLIIDTSVNVDVLPSGTQRVSTLIDRSGVTVRRTGRLNKGGFRFCARDLRTDALRHLRLRGRLHGTVRRGRLGIFCRPGLYLTANHLGTTRTLIH